MRFFFSAAALFQCAADFSSDAAAGAGAGGLAAERLFLVGDYGVSAVYKFHGLTGN